MTRFEREYREVEQDPGMGIVILKERKAELEEIEKEGKACKNAFRRECLAQEYVKLKREYDELSELV